MSLNKTQKKFKDLMLRPITHIESAPMDDTFISNHIDAKDRLKVYHNNVVGSLSEALRSTFPLVENLVGEDFFKGMARAFIFEHPPKNSSIHAYGAGFDDFISTFEPAQSLPYLADVASLEIATNNAYYAQDDTVMPADALTKIAPEDLGDARLALRSSAYLVSSTYPLNALRSFCLDQDNAPAPDLSIKHDCKLLILRPHLEVEIIPLGLDEYDMLHALHAGLTLGDAVAKTLSAHPDFDFAFFLQKHISLETFSHENANNIIYNN